MPAPLVAPQRPGTGNVRLAALAFSALLTVLAIAMSWTVWSSGAVVETPVWLVVLVGTGFVTAQATLFGALAHVSRRSEADRQSYLDLVDMHDLLKAVAGSDPATLIEEGLEQLRLVVGAAWTVNTGADGQVVAHSGTIPTDDAPDQDLRNDRSVLTSRLSNGSSITAGFGDSPPDSRAQRNFATAVDLLAAGIERSELQQRLDYEATHDPLTDLLTRRGFLRLADEHLRASDGRGTVLVVDLTRFAEINNTLGFRAADILLLETAKRLVAALGSNERVARLDGDSFAAFLPDGDPRTAVDTANRVRQALIGPVDLKGLSLTVIARIGVAVGPGHGSTTEELLRASDVAADLARDVQPPVVLYRAEVDVHSEARLELLHRMRTALDSELFEVWFQPKTDTVSGLVVGAEALLRWHDGDRWIAPDEFIPAAEAAGMMNDLTDLVLRQSLSAVARWRSRGRPIGVAVNLSPSSLEDPRLPGRISGLLTQFQVAPPALTIEITESVVMGRGDTAKEALTRLRALGVRLSVDDFGTGYSSLRYLKDLDVDELKLDRSFVLDLAVSDRSETIARAVVGLGHSLGLQVVAEGVETPPARDILENMKCDVLQGYLIARPMSGDHFDTWLRRYTGGSQPVRSERRSAPHKAPTSRSGH